MERADGRWVAPPILRSVTVFLDRDQDAELYRLQLLTARRADQLAAGDSALADDITIWLRAEEEILGVSSAA